MNSFKEFNLLPSLQAILDEKKIFIPTEIQLRALPILLAQKSVVGVAETGSGKTLAYVLPILYHLKTLETTGKAVKESSSPRALVIIPTRELGEQVSKVFKTFTHTTRLRVRTVLGGTTTEVAKKNIKGPFEVLIATPGRLIKFLDREIVNLADVRILVFDEADQMLDEGFLPDAKQIVEACPAERQLALFSATVSDKVQELMNELFTGVDVIRSQGSHKVVPSLTTQNLKVLDGKRIPLLEQIVVGSKAGGTVLFTNTREQCDTLSEILTKMGCKSAIYRGEMDKVKRRSNLKAFRDGKIDFLISTDLGSRGLDLEQVGRVINYHLPKHMENYLHRVGRTARAGRPGLVINFVTERDEPLMEQLHQVRSSRK
jgi:ATP-dependent RNA helicase RhlE